MSNEESTGPAVTRWIEFPSREELEAQWPIDIFDEAAELLLDGVLWLDLPTEERQDDVAARAFAAEEQLVELAIVWRRLRDGRVGQIDAHGRRTALSERLDLGSYTLGNGDHPELDEIWHEELEHDHSVSLDFKSFFVFGDLLLAAYVAMSEPAWEAPGAVPHWNGLTSFLSAVRRLRDSGGLDPATTFGFYMDHLFDRLAALDVTLGWYRDKWIVHVPRDMVAGGGAAMTVPLLFDVSHSRQKKIEEAQLATLRRTVRQVERTEGLDLGDDSHDPRPKLRKLARMLPELRDPASVKTVQNLLVEWGGESPPLLPTATALARLLEDWARLLVARVGRLSA